MTKFATMTKFKLLFLICLTICLISLQARTSNSSEPVLQLRWGLDDNRVGLAVEGGEEISYGFESPTSYYFYDNQFYILDAPNYRISVFDLQGKLKQTILLNEMIDEEQLYIYTDLAVADGLIYVASPHCGSIFVVDPSVEDENQIIDKITLPDNVETLFRIDVNSQSELIILDDPFGGAVLVIDFKGQPVAKLPDSFVPLLGDEELIGKITLLKGAGEKSNKESAALEFYNLSEYLTAPDKPLYEFELEFDQYLLNLDLLAMSAGDKNRPPEALIYAVTGRGHDQAEQGMILAVNPLNGEITNSINAPIAPEISMVRYIRTPAAPEEDWSHHLFYAIGNEEFFQILKLN